MKAPGTTPRRSIAAAAAAFVIAASVLVPLLDAGPIVTAAHLEQPDSGGCVHFQHNHFACHIFHGSPLSLPVVQRSGPTANLVSAHPLPAPVLRAAQVRTPAIRSRAPPRA